MTAVGIYSVNNNDKNIISLRTKVAGIVMKYDHVIQLHGFYVNEEEKFMQFDLIIDFEEKDRGALFNKAIDEVRKEFPEYKIFAALDTDFSLTE